MLRHLGETIENLLLNHLTTIRGSIWNPYEHDEFPTNHANLSETDARRLAKVWDAHPELQDCGNGQPNWDELLQLAGIDR